MDQPEPRPGRRGRLIALVVVIAVIAAALGGFLAVRQTGAGSLLIQTTQSFGAALDNIGFKAVIAGPIFTSPGPVKWDFGDGTSATSQGTDLNHAYAYAGTFFIAASSSLSNGKPVDNFGALLPMYVGPPRDLTTMDSLGTIALNTTASSRGAPFIASAGKIVATVAVQQAPTFFLSTNPNPTTWVNYTWAVTSLNVNFGDGSAPQTNATAPPFDVNHAYAQPGLYPFTVTVTTQNMSTTETVNPTSSVGPVPVSPAQTRSTTVGQTVAVGKFKPVTYSGSIINPGLVVKQEAVTGGFTSLDPGIDYESVGFEIIANVYQQLLWYNGAKTDQFVPVLADKIPSVADGSISPDHTTYTFHIRPGVKFAESAYGTVTPWDVKYSITRTMLFEMGHPGTNGWLISQFLVPDYTNGDSYTFDNLNKAITVDNASQTVTFHLQKSTPEVLFFQIVSDPLGAGIISSKWLDQHQPLTWTPQGFQDYKRFGSIDNYNAYTKTHTMGTGPYKIDYFTPGESVALVKSLSFTPTPGIPAPTVDRVFIQYVGEDSTRELSLESGKADIADIATSRFDNALRIKRNGLADILFNPTLNLFWWNFNLEIFKPTGQTDNNVPSNFFVDINVRKAFAYAWDYDNYINVIVGNTRFGAHFADNFAGIIPKGMIGYEDLTSQYDIWDQAKAKQFYTQSAWVQSHGGNPDDAKAGFHLTIIVPTADPVDKAAARGWGDNIQRLGAGITIDVKEQSFSDIIAQSIPHQDPMAIYYLGWLPDYPFPTDYTFPMLMPSTAEPPNGGTYPLANGFSIPYLKSQGTYGQADKQVTSAEKIADWINKSLASGDVSEIVDLSRKAQREFSNLTLFVYAQQQFGFITYRTWVSLGEGLKNPILGPDDMLFNLVTKQGSAQTSASASAAIGIDGGLAQGFLAPLAMLVALGPRGKSKGD